MNIASTYIVFVLPSLLLLVPFNFRLNYISGPKLNKFLAKIKNASSWVNDEPDGWFCGKWYVGHITTHVNEQGSKRILCLFSSQSFYKSVCAYTIEKSTDQSTNNITIKFWERQGSFWHIYYNERSYNPVLKKIWKVQSDIINRLLSIYQEKNYVVALLCSPPNKGKSYVPLYLCEKLLQTCDTVNLVDTWNPSEPGDSFSAMYNKINPTKKSPLIIVIEEVDNLIVALHNSKIKLSDNLPIPIQIKEKRDWNQFLDRFDRMMYQHVYVILTSNKSLEFFDSLDKSYMRDNRINYRLDLQNKK